VVWALIQRQPDTRRGTAMPPPLIAGWPLAVASLNARPRQRPVSTSAVRAFPAQGIPPRRFAVHRASTAGLGESGIRYRTAPAAFRPNTSD